MVQAKPSGDSMMLPNQRLFFWREFLGLLARHRPGWGAGLDRLAVDRYVRRQQQAVPCIGGY